MYKASNRIGFTLRLGALAAAMLLGQQAMAAGTRAGTTIENTASVGYEVSGIDQGSISSNTVTFVVDRRVNFLLVPASTLDLVPVTPGGSDYFVDFTLTNNSNSDLDFELAVANVTGGDVDGSGTDTVDLSTFDWAVVTAGDPTPTRGGSQIVDELAADASVRIRVFADADAGLANAAIAGLELSATAFEAGAAGLGAALAYGAVNTDAGIENVDVNGADGVVTSVDGFIVETAQLAPVKAYSVIAGDLGSGLPIPGATVEYTITIENTGASDATNVSITDALDTDLAFLAGQYAGSDIEIVNNGVTTQCSADAADGDSDGCSLDGVNLVFGTVTNPLTIAAATTLVVSYQVTILDPATTP